MKSRLAVRFIGFVAFLTIAGFSTCQDITDADAIRLAQTYAEALGHTPKGDGEAKLMTRSPFGGRPANYWNVVFDDATLILERSGLLMLYGWDGTTEDLPAGDPLASDEAAWEFAEDALAPLSVPEGLVRDAIRRYPEQGSRAATVSLFFEVRPNGYLTRGGNSAMVAIRSRDRRILSVGIGRGWNYETPNIQVSEAQAIAAAAAHTKSSGEGWKTQLSYGTNGRPEAPEAIRTLNEQRTFRLCYDVWSDRGYVQVDSVTGDVVSSAGPPSTTDEFAWPRVTKTVVVPSKVYANPKYKPIPPKSGSSEQPDSPEASQPTSPDSANQDSAPEGTNLPLIAGVAAVSAVVGFAVARWRK